jgi:hypothetical protein
MVERTNLTLSMIRLRWRADIVHDAESEEQRPDCGPWFPRTPENLRMLRIMRQYGIGTFGPGSHWIEEREA